MSSFFVGAQYILKGFRYAFKPELRFWVLLPVLLNVVVLGGASYWSLDVLSGWLTSLQESLPSWLGFLYWILFPIVFVAVLGLVTYFFSAILAIVASPLNGLLCEKTEAQYGVSGVDETLTALVLRTFKRELTKLVYLLPRYLVLFLVTLIPGVNVFSPALWLLLGGWVAAIQYMDYSYDYRGQAFSDTKKDAQSHRGLMFGFGLSVALLLAVPVFNWFVMPAAVVGATLMRIEKMQ